MPRATLAAFLAGVFTSVPWLEVPSESWCTVSLPFPLLIRALMHWSAWEPRVAGIIRAPMTSVFMIFELTQDYQILVPLMIANMISLAISKRFQPVPLYHALLHQDHVYLPDARTRMPAVWRARDIMVPNTIFISPEQSLAEAWKIVAETDAKSFVVGSNGSSAGLVTRDQIEEAVRLGMGTASLESILIKDCPQVYPDQPLELVIERLGKSQGLLPVVSRGDLHRVQGSDYSAAPDSVSPVQSEGENAGSAVTESSVRGSAKDEIRAA